MVLKGIFSKNKKKSEEEKCMLSNGAILLQELIASCDGKTNPIQIFSAKELEKATDNYAGKHILYREEYCSSYYKGIHENRMIIVRLLEVPYPVHSDSWHFKGVMNDIVILSQIHHKNVMKLLGCCLEAQCPIPVYKYSGEKNLKDYICDEVLFRQLSWEDRLRIATEISEALVYLHMATPKTIVHRNIHPGNIWLDEHYNSRVSNFCASKSIPEGEQHVQRRGMTSSVPYTDPECLNSDRFTEKSDVYSFGVVLFELLSGIQAFAMNPTFCTDQMSCRLKMVSHMENMYLNIEGVAYQKRAFTELAVRCILESGNERPTMKEACQELRRIRSSSAPPSASP